MSNTVACEDGYHIWLNKRVLDGSCKCFEELKKDRDFLASRVVDNFINNNLYYIRKLLRVFELHPFDLISVNLYLEHLKSFYWIFQSVYYWLGNSVEPIVDNFPCLKNSNRETVYFKNLVDIAENRIQSEIDFVETFLPPEAGVTTCVFAQYIELIKLLIDRLSDFQEKKETLLDQLHEDYSFFVKRFTGF